VKFLKYYSDLNNSYYFFKLILKLFFKLKKIKKYKTSINRKRKVNIYIGDWLSSALFPFTLYLGLLLNKKYKVIFLFDKFNLYNHSRSIFTNYLCLKILEYVKKKFNIDHIVLGSVTTKKSKSQFKDKIIKKMYIFNTMRYQRDAEVKIVKNNTYQVKKRLAYKIFDHLEQLIKTNVISKNDVNFIAGGYLNSSYLLNQLLRNYKINFYSYDSAPFGKSYSIFYCKNGIAGKMEESMEAYKNLNAKKYFTKLKLKKIKKIVLNEIQEKQLNKSKIEHFQVSKNIKIKHKNFAMITINSGWDANSLDSNHIFSNYLSFIKETALFFKKKIPNTKLIIKDHPYRKNGIITSDSVERVSKKISNKNVIFLDSSEANFYEIIKECRILISIASTSLNEAIIMNTPSISAGRDQYYHFNLGINARSKKEFFNYITNILRNNKTKKINKNKAFIFYYLSHIKRYLMTEFNPQNDNWLKYDINKLNNSNHLKLLRKIISSNKTFLEEKIVNQQ
jgi:hypothetical protein